MKELKTLLEQWATLAPERCSCSTNGRGEDIYHLNGFTMWKTYDNPRKGDLAILQGAVQEAIGARGWAWSIDSTYDYGKGKYKACINIPDDTDYWEPPYYATTAVQALLSIYLQALEKQMEVEG